MLNSNRFLGKYTKFQFYSHFLRNIKICDFSFWRLILFSLKKKCKFQLISVLVTNALDIISAYFDYYILSGPFLTEAIERIAQETDMLIKQKIADEVKKRFQSILSWSHVIRMVFEFFVGG